MKLKHFFVFLLIACMGFPVDTTLRATSAPENIAPTIQELSREVETIRNLKFKRPVEVDVLTDDKLTALLGRAFEEKKEIYQSLDTVVQLLGLLQPNTTFKGLLEPLYRQQVAGIYDPRVRKLYYRDSDFGGLENAILVHELTHALVDQSFDLKTFVDDPSLRNESEKQLAHQAVAEGDALLVMLVYEMRQMGIQIPSGVDEVVQIQPEMLYGLLQTSLDFGLESDENIPEWMVRMFLSPYLDGYNIVSYAYGKGGWEAVNNLYRRAPETSEHLLHPEQYFAREPVRLPTLPPPQKGVEVVFEEMFGELTWQIFLKNFLDDAEKATQAAVGWDGDRSRLLRNPSKTQWMFEVVSLWEDDKEAKEFSLALKEAMEKRVKSPKLIPVKYSIETKGDQVRLFIQEAVP